MQSKSIQQLSASTSKLKGFESEMSGIYFPVSAQKEEFKIPAKKKIEDSVAIMKQPSKYISSIASIPSHPDIKNDNCSSKKNPDVPTRSSNTPTSNESLNIGSRVEARMNQNGNFSSGKILRIRYDGTFDVYCDDGQRFLGLDHANVRPLNSTDESNLETETITTEKSTAEELIHDGGHYDIGAKVEARYRGNSTYYNGKIVRSRFDGSFDIQYDDGDRELGVPKDFIRIPNQFHKQRSSEQNVSNATLVIGTKIEAFHREKGIYCSGKILRKRFDGTYDVLYDDGQRELGVSQEQIRMQDSSISSGEEVLKSTECSKDSQSRAELPKFQPLKNNTFSSSTSSSFSADAYDDQRHDRMQCPFKYKEGAQESVDSFVVGERVESRFRGGATYFSGTITAVHDDEFYSITYDDGDFDERLSARHIRRTAVHTLNDSEEELLVGDEVEAVFGGSSYGQFYPGKIAKVHQGEGTFDIDYHDGDREKKVPRMLIKKLRAEDLQGGTTEMFLIGESVTARFKGTGGYYSGIITKVYPDNTVDIDYDDGDKDKKLSIYFVRKAQKESTPQPDVTKDVVRHLDASVSNYHDSSGDEDTVEVTTKDCSNSVSYAEAKLLENPEGTFILSSVKMCSEKIKRYMKQMKGHECSDDVSIHNFIKCTQAKDEYSSKIINIISNSCLCEWIVKERFSNDKEYAKCLMTHHAVMQYAHKCKETLDDASVAQLELAISEIEKFYLNNMDYVASDEK